MAPTSAQSGTTPRKPKARLSDMETREVSGVDRPANGEPYVVVKSEAGLMEDTSKRIVAPAASDGEGPVSEGPPSTPAEEGVTMIMPSAVQTALVAGLSAARGRIDQILAAVQGASVDETAPVPVEPLVGIADAASILATTIEPYVQSDGMIGGADVDTALAEQEKAKTPAPGAPAPAGQASGERKPEGMAKAALTWSREYIDALPDGCFAYVEPSTSQRDTEWRTQPLSNRHFPIRDHAYRLSLPGVLDAIDQVRASAEPWISEPLKRALLLRIADERLCEVMVIARRETVLPPEAAAELAAIAELIASVAGILAAPPTIAPAEPAAGETPVAQAEAPPIDFSSIAQKARDALVEIRKSATGAVSGDAFETMGQVQEALKTALGGVEAIMAARGAASPASAPAAAASTPKPEGEPGKDDALKQLGDQVTELGKSVTSLKVALGKSEAESTALRTQVAKMARGTPASAILRDDPAPPVKKATPPLSQDLNAELFPESAEPTSGHR